MSRRLAVVVAMIPIYQKGDDTRDSANVPHSHLIAVDQDTGKGVMLDLENVGLWKWRGIPDIPVKLLDAEQAPFVSAEPPKSSLIFPPKPPPDFPGDMPGDAQAALTFPSQLPKDVDGERYICCGGAKSVGHRAHCDSLKDLHGSSAWERGESARTIDSDIAEDR